MSLALNSHSVISPSLGGGGKTDNEDIDFRKPFLFANSKVQSKDGGKTFPPGVPFQLGRGRLGTLAQLAHFSINENGAGNSCRT